MDTRKAMHVSLISLIGNALLSVFKLFAGIAAHSHAMVSDAVHSASDLCSTLIVMAGVRAAAKAPDKEHPFGHERLESIAALLLALALIVTGIGIGWSGIHKLVLGRAAPLPGVLALIAAAFSIIVKEAMFQYTKAAAVELQSGALLADAWHHRSDALSSIGSFLGVLGARSGLPVLDSLASVVICICIVKAGITILADSMRKLVDCAADEEIQAALKQLVQQQQGVVQIDRLRTRLFGERIYVEVEIGADQHLTLTEAHTIAQHVHDAVEQQFPNVKHCMVHVNPV